MQLVGQEVVPEPLHQCWWQIPHLCNRRPQGIVFEYGNDLVVCFASIQHRQATNHAGIQNDFPTRDRTLTNDPNVEQVTISGISPRHERVDPGGTVRSRNESIERWRLRRCPLRSVDPQVPGPFVDLVFQEIERADLDVRVDK